VNPLRERGALPAFDRIQPEHVEPALASLLEDLNRRLTGLETEAAPEWATVAALNDIEYELLRTFGPASHLLGVMNSPELREAYEVVQKLVVEFYLRLGQSRPLFEAMQTLHADSERWGQLDEGQRRAIELRLRDMRHSGVGLEGAARERFNEIAQESSKLGTDFSNHVLDATRAFRLELKTADEIAGLPPSYLQAAAQSWNNVHPDAERKADPEQGPWLVTLDGPSFLPFMQHAKRRDLREKVYRAYLSRSAANPELGPQAAPEYNNEPLIQRALELRQEQAALLGFANWAELSLDSKMAGSVDDVEKLLEELRQASLDPARDELNDLFALAAKDDVKPDDFRHWDVAYYAERLREDRFQFTDEELRPYFPMPRVLEGLFDLVGRLFGVQIRPADGEAPVWHEDVRYFIISDDSGADVAAFYLDPYSRPENKRGGAWMDVCIPRRRKADGGIETPVAYLVCNGTPPVGERPSLMSFREVETLFHEFGHGLQHMLTRVDVPDVSGISGVEWDAVELPSQFMENWCYHKPTLLGMTRHVDTGEPMPEDLFERIKNSRTFRAASMMLRQLRFALTDMELHARFDPQGDESVWDVQRRMEAKTSLLSPFEDDFFLCSFAHIFAGGYSAGYYSYKWAEVLSADAFAAFEEAGLDNEAALRSIGRRFRDTILALGGSRPAGEVFEEFRGRGPSTDPLLRHSGLRDAA